LDIDNIKKVESESDCLCTSDELIGILDKMAGEITADLQDKNPMVLCVVNGGIIPTGHLLTRLTFPLQLDYVHATRYQGKIAGGKLEWLHEPSVSLSGRHVLLIDDIFDEGITLLEIEKFCLKKGAESVSSAVIVNKIHNRKVDYKVDYIGINIEDRYLFGFGMDYKNYLRNINAIHAVKDL